MAIIVSHGRRNTKARRDRVCLPVSSVPAYLGCPADGSHPADGDLRTRGYSTTQVSLVMSSSLKLWYGFFALTVCICSLTAAS